MYETRLGHAHLKVRDLDRAVAFYRELLGLSVAERVGDAYAFLAPPGGPRHGVALRGVGPSAPAAPCRAAGLYRLAFEVPDERSLAEARARLEGAGVEVAAVDRGAGRALLFGDPDGNGVEVYLDARGRTGGASAAPGGGAEGKPAWR